jgi:hypothetical protein
MDSFDLNSTSKLRVNNVISKSYGGRYSRSEALQMKRIGAGGMIYMDETLKKDTHVKCTLEILKGGLAIYFRNIDENRILIFAYDELESISFTKEADILVEKPYSIFKSLLSFGVNFFYARIFLFEHEIINDFKAELLISPQSYSNLKLFVTRKSPKAIGVLLQNLKHKVNTNIDIQEYKYI